MNFLITAVILAACAWICYRILSPVWRDFTEAAPPDPYYSAWSKQAFGDHATEQRRPETDEASRLD